MITFVYGPDGYRLLQYVRDLQISLHKQHPHLGLFVIDLAENTNLESLQQALKSQSLFDTDRSIHIRNAFGKKLLGEELVALIDERNLATDTTAHILITAEGEESTLSKKNSVLFKRLTKKDVAVVPIAYLKGLALEKWIITQCATWKCTIEPTAIKHLIARTGIDSWRIVTELEKLTCYALQSMITSDLVGQLVHEPFEVSIFSLTDALAANNKPRALGALFGLLASGTDPYPILATIITYNRNLLLIKDCLERGMPTAQIPEATGIHPFVVRNLVATSRALPIETLRITHAQLLALDTQTKKGNLNLTDSLYAFILQ